MGKLVLGIIVVSLLQIAFFVYTWTDGAATIARRDIPRPIHGKNLVNLPTASQPAADSLWETENSDELRAEPRISTRESSVRASSLYATRRLARTIRHKRNRVDQVAQSKPILEPTVITYPTHANYRSPRKLAVVLTDYPTPPRAETRMQNKTLTRAPGTRVDIASRPKRRSYVARVFPALIKKPWKWIKSLGSRFD
jgi:hypothetical protein